jgi:1-hydroxycarotenoid 3,4-desaturase
VSSNRVAIVGAGIGGLAAAVDLSSRGIDVVVVERAAAPGGKMREVEIAGARLDAGPTVFTMRQVFEELFADAGTSLAEHVTLKKVEILARHAWSEHERLDLFADPQRSAAAIGEFSGAAEAHRFLDFSEEARRTYEMLEQPYLRSQRPNPIGLTRALAADRLSNLWNLRPFTGMWRALGSHFQDPRLRQLFGRYSTYCGSSPFLAPATLMLIAHVEREGVWLIEGGMHRLAAALAGLAQERGAVFRYGTEVAEVLVEHGRAAGIRLAGGEQIAADAVLVNADTAAVASGLLGARIAQAVSPLRSGERSLSALTWNLVASTQGFPLLRHTVFFSGNYAAEFDDLFGHRRLPTSPTVYVCAQDRDDGDQPGLRGPERLLCLVNAPPTGDQHSFDAAEIESCQTRTFAFLERCGLRVHPQRERTVITTPRDFHRLFPGTGGALYGQATHGWRASFRRPRTRTSIPGLYLAGGSTHPGAGVPLAALSGRLAAECLVTDYVSMRQSRKTGTHGGISTR